ncbi:hypothetical protein KY366_08730 [Candidatus Woesearchaeota archaeon]|nr:hypothetical protein [Candidatus Woesearchaeota archaeon]
MLGLYSNVDFYKMLGENQAEAIQKTKENQELLLQEVARKLQSNSGLLIVSNSNERPPAKDFDNAVNVLLKKVSHIPGSKRYMSVYVIRESSFMPDIQTSPMDIGWDF